MRSNGHGCFCTTPTNANAQVGGEARRDAALWRSAKQRGQDYVFARAQGFISSSGVDAGGERRGRSGGQAEAAGLGRAAGVRSYGAAEVFGAEAAAYANVKRQGCDVFHRALIQEGGKWIA